MPPAVVLVAAGTALGQLSPADIAALQERGRAEEWTFTVGKNPATARPMEDLCGLIVPEDWWKDARFDPCTPTRDLPESFDWRELGGCTSVKDQGGCGSCWAFATVGPLECNILIKDGVEVDLSEQWLVSCNEDGWGCDGGWWAHDYHQWKTDWCGGTGAVLEADFPYTATDAPCVCPYPHEYWIEDWAFIGEPWTIAPVNAIKQAIMDYGPVTVGIAVDSVFKAYDTGVFNACGASDINHGVVLVGWDDNQGSEGVWFLRNSWSSGWGEGGYMRIEYGCNRVGYHACYVDYVYAGVGSVRTCEVNKLVASDAESGAQAQFGHAVSADGEVAVIGARTDPCGAGSQCGSAYVYRWSGSLWDEEDKLTASDADTTDLFGSSVAVAGDIAVAGSPSDDHEGGTDAGSAYVYEWDGNAWGSEQKLTAPDTEANDQFGSSVAVEADVVLVGAKNEGNTGGSDGSGAVYVFRNNGSSWAFEDKLTALDTAAGDQLGGSVSINGGVAVLGAGYTDCAAGSSCGAAYVFHWNGSSWVEQQKLSASDAAEGDRFGSSVSIDGSLILVGAWLADCGAESSCGAAYVYGFNEADWIEEGKLTGLAAGDLFGCSVSIHNNIGLVGARSVDCVDGNNCGAAYVVRQIEENWVLDGKLSAADAAAGDIYGVAVALGEHVALIGASLHDLPELDNAGAAYAYAFPVDCNHNSIADTCDILGGTSADTDPPDGVPDECICLESSPPEAQRLALPGDPISQKVRYLSFSAGDPGAIQAIRVIFDDLPPPYDAWDAVTMWVAEPTTYCENAGKRTPPCPTVQPSSEFTGATLQCEPYYMDWSGLEDVHVYHEGIIPGGSYQIQVIDETCDINLQESYSAPLAMTQSNWGDLVRTCATCPCSPPDGVVNMASDVTAVLDKFRNLEPPDVNCAPVTKARADLDWETPNQLIDISDATCCLDAFRGMQYPPEAFPDPPTEDPCPGS